MATFIFLLIFCCVVEASILSLIAKQDRNPQEILDRLSKVGKYARGLNMQTLPLKKILAFSLTQLQNYVLLLNIPCFCFLLFYFEFLYPIS